MSRTALGTRDIGRIDQHGNRERPWAPSRAEVPAASRQSPGEKIDPGQVSARPGKASDEAKLDRVFADAEDDRDRRGRSFGRKRSRVAGWRGDNGHATADEVGHERRKAIELALQPMVLHRHVLALDVAGFVEAFAERGDKGASIG